MSDTISRFIFDKTHIRGEIVTLEKSFQDAISHQNIPRQLLPIFADFFVGVSLLGEILKFEGILTLQARGQGPVPVIMTEINHRGEFRGILRTSTTQFDSLDLPALLGKNANLSITIDPTNGQRYQGIVPVEHANLADCLVQYFEQSEQLPTYLSIFSDGNRCAGLFLQQLPEDKANTLEVEDTWETALQLANTLQHEEIFITDHQTILFRLFHELDCRMFTPKHITFNCSCTRERSAQAIVSLGEVEAQDVIEEQGTIKIDCQFCGTRYSFNENDVAELFGGNGSLH